MSAFLHQPTSLPGLASSYAQQPQCRPRLLSSIAHILRKPSSVSAHLLDDLRTGPFVESAQAEHAALRSILHLKLKTASTLQEWRSAAVELDRLEANDDWKHDPSSIEYDARLVESRLKELDEARISCDTGRMLFLVRTSLSRYLGGMGNSRLYKHSHIGTKELIERYINCALETITCLLDQTKLRSAEVESRVLLEQVVAARQSFGRSALLLSGGGTFGMNHIGVIKCLWEVRLLPRIISGSSAGSIVCAVLCTRTDEEIPKVLKEFCYGDLEVFTRKGEDDGVLRQLSRFLKIGALFDIGNLTRVMKDLLGDLTFQEAYNRTRRILNIHVSSASLYELPKLLNYITSPNVIIWSAVAASCSVPVLFTSASILAKDPRTGEATPWNPSTNRWIDGSVDSDLPMARLAEMFNVNHFIVSQVNPHVIPFLKESEELVSGDDEVAAPSHSWLQTFANLAKDEVMHRMHIMAEVGVLPNLFTKARSVLNQKYSGDINIFPEVPYSSFPQALVNPTMEFMLQASLCGERATWPKLSMIQNHCAIELALDDAVQQLRARIAFSPSQVDLRMNVISRPVSRAGSESTGYKRRKCRALVFDHSVDGLWPYALSPPPPYSDVPVTLSLVPNTYAHTARGSGLYAESESEYEDDDNEYLTISAASAFSRRTSRRLFPIASQPSTPYARTVRHGNSYFPEDSYNASPRRSKSYMDGAGVMDSAMNGGRSPKVRKQRSLSTGLRVG